MAKDTRTSSSTSTVLARCATPIIPRTSVATGFTPYSLAFLNVFIAFIPNTRAMIKGGSYSENSMIIPCTPLPKPTSRSTKNDMKNTNKPTNGSVTDKIPKISPDVSVYGTSEPL